MSEPVLLPKIEHRNSTNETAASSSDDRTSQLTVEENRLDGTNDYDPGNDGCEEEYPRILQIKTADLVHTSITDFNRKYVPCTDRTGDNTYHFLRISTEPDLTKGVST